MHKTQRKLKKEETENRFPLPSHKPCMQVSCVRPFPPCYEKNNGKSNKMYLDTSSLAKK